MEVTGGPFVTALRTEPFLRGREIENPSWKDVDDAIALLGAPGGIVRLELVGRDGARGLTMHGERDSFHICIDDSEKEYHTYVSDTDRGKGTRDIAGRTYDANEVCTDRVLVKEIAQAFWNTGEAFPGVHWVMTRVGEG